MNPSRQLGWSSNANPLQDEIKQVFERFFGDAETADASSVVTSQWVPRVDIKEEPERFVIFADLPGVDPNEIEVHMDKGMLSIRGERRTDERTENERYSRVERAHGDDRADREVEKVLDVETGRLRELHGRTRRDRLVGGEREARGARDEARVTRQGGRSYRVPRASCLVPR